MEPNSNLNHVSYAKELTLKFAFLKIRIFIGKKTIAIIVFFFVFYRESSNLFLYSETNKTSKSAKEEGLHTGVYAE